MSILTSDPKSGFLCQSSLIAQNLQTPLEITSYAWDISHALVTMYHLYCHSLGALTEYLKQKLCFQRAKRLGRSLPAQVEPSVQLEHNIADDNEWIQALDDTRFMHTGWKLQQIFVTIVRENQPAQPAELWDKFKTHLCDDLPHHLCRQSPQLANLTEDLIFNYGLFLIQV